MESKTAILLVDDWYSTCSYCGKQVLPEEKSHINVSGYNPVPEGGCGAVFVGVFSTRGDRMGAQRLRSDLPYCPVLRPDLPYKEEQ